MSLGLFISVALLGLAAIDPIGIAAMPILLVQKHPLARSTAFLSGSFVALLLMGLLFARGFGTIVLRFEATHSWLVPLVELLAGLVLLVIGFVIIRRQKTQPIPTEPSDKLRRRLNLNSGYLFVLGAGLVTIQSILDVVFVVAMVRIGQLYLSVIGLILSVLTYALAALVLQISVVIAYQLAPASSRDRILRLVRQLLKRYANKSLIIISLSLGIIFIVDGLFMLF